MTKARELAELGDAVTVDSGSGSVLVGKTSADSSTDGVQLIPNGISAFGRDGGEALRLNRNTSDGEILRFQKAGVTVGSMGVVDGDIPYFTSPEGTSGLKFDGDNSRISPCNSTGAILDDTTDLGNSNARFDDIFATNSTIQTSDRNEKQDIEELTDAEQRVAVAAKGLMRKFRWKSAVAEKGDNARTHFGIIAQDLQAAFEAEGLNAGDYAIFTSNTWWETSTEVPAVEADEENGIEARDAYTRVDTYETEDEAPEGATQRTRLGVRYSELLAFIIAA